MKAAGAVRATFAPLAASLLLAGCAAAAPPPATPSAAPAAAADPVLRAAELLAEAAATEGNIAVQLPTLETLDRIALRKAEDSEDDPVAAWRRAAIAGGANLPPSRGRALGPAYRSGWLDAGGRKSLEQIFLAGQTARIVLSSPDQRPVTLTINDPAGKTICQQDKTSPSECRWLALFTQRYRIEIANPGTDRLRYFLVTN